MARGGRVGRLALFDRSDAASACGDCVEASAVTWFASALAWSTKTSNLASQQPLARIGKALHSRPRIRIDNLL